MTGASRVSARWRPSRESTVALLLYTAYALFVTWPLVLHPGSMLSGTSVAGDLGGSVASLAYSVQHHVFPFAPAVETGLNAPQGLQQPWVDNWVGFTGDAPLYVLSLAFGAVAGSNLFLWLSYVLSGQSMFLLVRRIFGSFGAALLTGFAFGFFPWAINKLNGHYQYMDGFVLVLGVWRMLELIERPTIRNALIAGAAIAFGLWWTPYFFLIGGVEFAVMEIVLIVVLALRHRFRAGIGLAATAVVPIVVLLIGLGALAHFAGGTQAGAIRVQSITELYTYSVHGLEWVLPDPNNFIFGGLTSSYLNAHLEGSNYSEASIYLGVSVLLLACGGLVAMLLRVRTARRAAASDRWVVTAVAGVLLAFFAAWFSAPPRVHIAGVSIPMPSDVIYQFTSTFRVYSRFVELIELGLCLPMAWAITLILRRRRAAASVAAFAALAVILMLDLWARPADRTVSLTPPPPYVWLRHHPGGIVADYPVEPAAYPDYADLYWQTYDRHPLLQGYASGSESESMKLDLVDLTEPKVASYLAALGVRYIIVRPGEPGATLQTATKYHYKIRFSSPEGSVWQVGAAPAASRVDMLDGFSTVEGTPGLEYRWMGGPGVLGVYASHCASCLGKVTFLSTSNVVARVLTVSEEGHVLVHAPIPAGTTTSVTVPGVHLHNGTARLNLTTNIPPQQPGNGDPRFLSVTVTEPGFHPAH